jgi:GNAT superfamily N-acetyltransferase
MKHCRLLDALGGAPPLVEIVASVRGRSIDVREAVLGDVRTLVELMAEFYAESDYVLDRARADAAFTVLLSDPRLGRVWLIEQASAAVGYVVVTFVYGMEYGGFMAFVDDFFVRPACRNAGLGTEALAAARDTCVKLGVRAMSVEVAGDNDPALAVYRRTGFALTDRKLMVLPLAAPTHEQ